MIKGLLATGIEPPYHRIIKIGMSNVILSFIRKRSIAIGEYIRAPEINRLREQLRSAPSYEKEIRRLQTRISELTGSLLRCERQANRGFSISVIFMVRSWSNRGTLLQ